MLESEIQNAILHELGRESDVTLWRNNTGQAKEEVCTREHLERLMSFISEAQRGREAGLRDAQSLIRSLLSERQRHTRYGLCVGSSDIIGIVRTPEDAAGCETCRIGVAEGPHTHRPSLGIFLALEVKSSTGRVSKEQQMFLDLVNRRGGVGRVVRSVNDARKALDEARAL